MWKSSNVPLFLFVHKQKLNNRTHSPREINLSANPLCVKTSELSLLPILSNPQITSHARQDD